MPAPRKPDRRVTGKSLRRVVLVFARLVVASVECCRLSNWRLLPLPFSDVDFASSIVVFSATDFCSVIIDQLLDSIKCKHTNS